VLETDLYGLLSTDASIAAATGTPPGIYLGAIPKGQPDSNAVVIQVTNTLRDKGYDVTSQLVNKRVQFDSYHVKYTQAVLLSNAVLNLVKDMSGNLATVNVQGVIPDKDIDLGEEPGDTGYVFRRMLDFEVLHSDLVGQGGTPFVPIAPPVAGANAAYLEGIPVAAGTPTDGQTLVYNAAAQRWQLGTVQGGGSAVNFSDNETPAGTVDGVNAAFTWVHTPISGSLLFTKNGQVLIAGVAYTLAANVATFNPPYIPQLGDILAGWYRY
jgi:hypothetical protein